ncbi:MAG TPA: condensation domain-containing protein, partial [Thermoanaerobaculia bacterium]|nr:condensation domain-containing protein [Thermoanaerobaculia bacterium]
QIAPGSPAYNIPLALSLSGALSVPALEAALGEVVRRHEVLRTVFAAVDGRPVQRILAARPLSLPLVDLAGLDAEAREKELARLVRREAEMPFDLGQGPLFRSRLLCLEPGEHALLLTQHHIVSDGWSLGLTVREGSALYAAFSSGRPSPLADLELQYADFAVWQRQWLSEEVQEEQLAYWRRQLAGLPVLELPTDRPRRAVRRQRGGSQAFTLSAGLSRSLMELGQREGATLFMTLLTCLQILLSRYSGEDDLAIGTPVANRRRLELEELIGFFVNTLVLRGNLSGRPAFRDLLRHAREAALEAYAHQDIPFEQLVEELQPARDPSRTPLFQVMLALQNTPEAAAELPGLRVAGLEVETATAKFDLTLAFAKQGELLEGVVEYDRDLFDAATIRRMLGHFERLAAAAVAGSPETPVAQLDLLSSAEREQLLGEWAARSRVHPFRAGVHESIVEAARRRPEALALAWKGGNLSFGELAARAGRLARELRRRGVGPEVIVAVLLERSPELVVGSLAVLEAGGAYLPLDPAS